MSEGNSNINNRVFFSLLSAGLWEESKSSQMYGNVDWNEVYRIAEEQSVIGLVADGIDRFKIQVPDFNIPQGWALQFIGSTLQVEQQNKAMNEFVGNLIGKLRRDDIYALLVKGQGVAQCYDRPLWRASGDVDLFLSEDNYEKAKTCLIPVATEVESEYKYSKHLGLTIDGWVVELHGSLRCGLSFKIDKCLDEIQYNTFYGGNVRSWDNKGTQVFMLAVENDAIYIFTHILNHFYKGGLGVRQICDWCRLLWTYRDSLNRDILQTRIKRAGLMSEWRAFGAFAVEYLGMPVEAIPFLNDNHKVNLKKKAERIKDFILMSGNFGHNRDSSYFNKYPFFVRKVFSAERRMRDLFNHALIFPLDSLKFSFYIMYNGLKSALKGEG